MSDPALDPRRFYAELIPAQWNRAFDEQPRDTEEQRRVHDGMRAVNATIRVEVHGDDGGAFFLNIRAGRMEAGEGPLHAPFLTLIQERAAFERLAREAGDSALALLGGLSGATGELKLTRARVELLAGLRGLVRFEVSGSDGFALLSHFGPDPVPAEPTASIRVDESAYRALRAGEIDPPTAFLDGRIDVSGDMQLAMQLALAAVAPD